MISLPATPAFALAGLLLGDLFVDVDAANCPAANGSLSAPYCSITEALAAAAGGDVIHVAAGTYVESLAIDLDVTIRGTEGEGVTIVRPAVLQSGDTQRVVRIEPGRCVVLEGITVTGGGENRGGGISTSGRLTLKNATVSGNLGFRPLVSEPSLGAGVFVGSGGALRTEGATIDSNEAGGFFTVATSLGGGVFVESGDRKSVV